MGGVRAGGRRKEAAQKEGQKEERRGRVAAGERAGRSLLEERLKVEEPVGGGTGGSSEWRDGRRGVEAVEGELGQKGERERGGREEEGRCFSSG